MIVLPPDAANRDHFDYLAEESAAREAHEARQLAAEALSPFLTEVIRDAARRAGETRWGHAAVDPLECPRCGGGGEVPGQLGEHFTCPVCRGSGLSGEGERRLRVSL